jgi:hypothetical protein
MFFSAIARASMFENGSNEVDSLGTWETLQRWPANAAVKAIVLREESNELISDSPSALVNVQGDSC